MLALLTLLLLFCYRYGCRLVSFNEITMYQFFVTFMAVFFSGQATSQIFQFSTSTFTYHDVPLSTHTPRYEGSRSLTSSPRSPLQV